MSQHLPGAAARTGGEIAAGEIGGEDLAVIHSDDWRRIVRIPGLPSLILDRAERGGLAAVNELLDHYSAGQARPPAMLRYLELSPDPEQAPGRLRGAFAEAVAVIQAEADGRQAFQDATELLGNCYLSIASRPDDLVRESVSCWLRVRLGFDFEASDLPCFGARARGTKASRRKEVMMSRKTHRSDVPSWLKAVIYLTVASGAAAGTGHVVSRPAPQPTTACVELQAVLAGRVS